MLLKVTNRCGMGCSHCMEDSTVAGQHMTWETFERAIAFTRRVESTAWALGCPPLILLSGGECTEHPDIVRMVETVVGEGLGPVLITNGLWLGDRALRESLLRPEWDRLSVQVTHDPRFYPTAPPAFDDRRIVRIDAISAILPLGRAQRRALSAPTKKAPGSFNLRSFARASGSFERAVTLLRLRASTGLPGHCIPSVTDAGDVMAGESRNCFKIGTVDSPMEELTAALLAMRCNACGLVDNLTPEQKVAIGEA